MNTLRKLIALAANRPIGGGGGTPIAFVDDFNDGVIDTTKWTLNESGGHLASEVGGQLVMTPVAYTVGSVQMLSPVMDFTGKSVEFGIGQVTGGDPFMAGYNYTQIRVQKDASNFVYFDLAGSHPFRYSGFSVVTGGSDGRSEYGASGWGLLGMRLKFSFFGTTVRLAYWNGSTFVTQEDKTVSWDLTALQIVLFSGYWGTGNYSVQPATYDDVISDATYIP